MGILSLFGAVGVVGGGGGGGSAVTLLFCPLFTRGQLLNESICSSRSSFFEK